ncbi:Os08g0343550, partial [Oryza sativa Japonica Group]
HRPCNINHLFLVSDSNSELVLFYRMFYRSVSNYCINNVVCPVVLIKGT